MVKVRDAELGDVEAIVEMGRAMHAESPRWRHHNFDPDKVLKLTQALIMGRLPGGVLVAEKDGHIVVGMMGFFVTPAFFGHDKIASDFVLYLVPEQRKTGRAALNLVRAFEQRAKAMGAVDICPGTSTGVDPDGTRRFFEKLGYRHNGHSMFKRI